MAFGIIPKHVRDVTFENLISEQILIIALEAAKKLEWKIGHTSVNGFIAYTNWSLTSWSEQVTVRIEGNKTEIRSECTGSQMVDWGKNERNVDAFIKQFREQIPLLSQEEIATRFLEVKSSGDANDEVLNQPLHTSRDKIKNVLSIFVPAEGYFVAPIIINLNILVFVLMAFSGVNIMLPDSESLIAWGANFRPVTLDGQWWRLLTSCFLHIGILHLLMNMYALVYISLLLEPQLGRTRYLTAYLVSGIGGSAASLYWHDLTISAGASGAIFGMYGVFLAMLTTNLIEKSARNTMLTSILIFVGYNLLNGVRGGIDNAAHIGGLVVGIITGYAFYPGLKNPNAVNFKYLGLSLPVVLVAVSSFVVYTQTSSDVAKYQKVMDQFAILESQALEIYSKIDNTPDTELLKEITERGIPNWKESIRIITESNKLDIPVELIMRNRKLVEYCQLRLESYEVLQKAITENSDQYTSTLEEYNQKLEAVLKELTGEK